LDHLSERMGGSENRRVYIAPLIPAGRPRSERCSQRSGLSSVSGSGPVRDLLARSAVGTGQDVPTKPVLQLTLVFNHNVRSTPSPKKPCNQLIAMQIAGGWRLVASTTTGRPDSKRTRVHNMARCRLSSERSRLCRLSGSISLATALTLLRHWFRLD
jgi:hypothetical protein